MQERDEKKLKELKFSYRMYEKTKKETRESLRKKVDNHGNRIFTDDDVEARVAEIAEWQKEQEELFFQLGGRPEELYITEEEERKTEIKNRINKKIKSAKNSNNALSVQEKLEALNKKNSEKEERIEAEKPNNTPVKQEKPAATETTIELKKPADNSFIPRDEFGRTEESFDVIPLPSGGECYANKLKRVQVSYLNAYDENIIASPNLYRDNLVLDYLLDQKIMNEDVVPGDLIEGDREAVILWLRATGYGNMYPVDVVDRDNDINFQTVVDLSELKFKDFTLTGDENGWFEYEVPLRKDKIKFKYLTHNEIKQILELEKYEDMQQVKGDLKRKIEDIQELMDSIEHKCKRDDITEYKNAIGKLKGIEERIEVDEEILFTNVVTNRLESSIMSVNGNTDRKFISNYVRTMPTMDSSSLRNYMARNEPGIDYTITVQKPESLGGGSMKLFLQLDINLFLRTV